MSRNDDKAAAREAIANFVNGNADKMQGWLDAIANGQKNDGGTGYITRPDPEKAFRMVLDMIEYCVPKLARTEITGKDGGPLSLASLIASSYADGSKPGPDQTSQRSH